MNPYQAYQQQRAVGLTRIDMLLALYDKTIERLEQALAVLSQQGMREALPLLNNCQMLVTGLAAGVDPKGGDLARNVLRLFVFVSNSLCAGRPDKLQAALQVLRTLREGYQTIRPEAVELERQGTIPPLDAISGIQRTA